MVPHRAFTLVPAFIAALVVTLISSWAYAQSEPASPVAKPVRPRVALVLSGGGARGLAHIGALRVLRELRVPVDMVVGTSMGAVIGGAYAAGRSAEELDRITRETDWASVLADRPARDTLDFRRREEDRLLPSRIEFAATKAGGVSLPPAAASNAELEEALDGLLPPGTRDRRADQLAIPFRSVASDLVSGELVELSDTSLFLAMRASLAVPGVFAPVRVNGRLMADGGLVRNLPVDMARAMGADIVIAVNVGTPLAPESELTSAIGVARQMLQILTEQNVQRSIKELGPDDILITPELNGITFLDFAKHEQAIRAGEAATRKLADKLRRLAVPASDYIAFEEKRRTLSVAESEALPLGKIEVHGVRHINPEALLLQSELHEGDKMTPEQIRRAAARLYGRGDLDNVDTVIEDADGKRNVVIKPVEANWGRNRLRVGLELASDFSDVNSFSLGLMHVASSLNDSGAELRTIGRIGTRRHLGFELWQPMAAGSPWYVAPSVEYDSHSFDSFDRNGRRQLRAAARTFVGTLAAGRQLSNWGDIRFGVRRGFYKFDLLLPEKPEAPDEPIYGTTQFISLRSDTLDSLAFPTRGHLATVGLDRSPSRGPYAPPLLQPSATVLKAFAAGDWAGHLYGEWGGGSYGSTGLRLGGFLRLSGTARDSIYGNKIAFGRAVVARKIGLMPPAIGGAIRLGMSTEFGRVSFKEPVIALDESGHSHFTGWNTQRRAKSAASVFLAADTRFGPLYFGAGATRGTGGTLYLFLGPTW